MRSGFRWPPLFIEGKILALLFKFKLTRTLTIFGDDGILALVKYTIMANPIKSLEFHYPMIQFFLINRYIPHDVLATCVVEKSIV